MTFLPLMSPAASFLRAGTLPIAVANAGRLSTGAACSLWEARRAGVP